MAIILSVIVIPSVVPSEKIGSMEHRTIIWEMSLRMVSVSPKRLFFGYGLEQFKTQFPLFVNEKDARYFTDNTPDRAHNIFLDILFSFGLVGLAFFLMLLIGFFRRNPLSSEKSHVTILFLLFFSFNVPVLVHFLMVGLVVSLRNGHQENT